MQLAELTQILDRHNYGIRAYERFSEECLKRATDSRSHAICYFLLSCAADEFVRRYDEQPLSTSIAHQHGAEMRSIIATMEQAMVADEQQMLAIINDFVIQTWGLSALFRIDEGIFSHD